MRRIAVLNQKGGVGKTTTTVNLAAALAAEGNRTLVLDLDPQAHATLHLGLLPGRSGPSLYDVLTQGMSLAEVRREVAPNLHICGSHIDLAAAEVELIGTVGREVILRDQLDADTALACGLADRAGGTDEALEWAHDMTSLAPLTQAYSKRVLNAVFEPELEEALGKELDAAFEACWASEDFAEGRRSRAEKRPPVFRGR